MLPGAPGDSSIPGERKVNALRSPNPCVYGRAGFDRLDMRTGKVTCRNHAFSRPAKVYAQGACRRSEAGGEIAVTRSRTASRLNGGMHPAQACPCAIAIV